MIKTPYISRLGLKFTSVSAVALVFAFAVFLFLYEGLTMWALDHIDSSSFWETKGSASVESFQEYVNENHLSVEEAIQDVRWEKTHRNTYLHFVSSGSNSSYPVVSIICSDGTAYAYVLPSISHYDNIGMVVSLCAAGFCFFVILIPYVYHIIRRITHLSQEMGILTGGELNYHIESTGNDELSELGRSIEGMRLSVIDQMENENRAVLANSRLITSLSHDLRTPLTKLTGYLEILRYKSNRNLTEEDRYLNLAIENAEQIKQMSDEMFRKCLVVSEYVKEENETSDSLLLSRILSELCFDLRNNGFTAEPPSFKGTFVLSIPVVRLRRIFDNLFSNIKKYADCSKPVQLSILFHQEKIEVIILNSIRSEPVPAGKGNGIGLPTVQQLISESDGHAEFHKNNNTFSVHLFFPLYVV